MLLAEKLAAVISCTMASPNILAACIHPYSTIRKNNHGHEHAIVEYKKFLIELVNKETCFNLNISKIALSKCTCLHDLREDEERLGYAAEHMWYFGNLTNDNQHQLVSQWIRYKDKIEKKRPFKLPVRRCDNGPPCDALETAYPICKLALQTITQFGTGKFRTAFYSATCSSLPQSMTS
jgi:hypothetical protein